jgi:hypothetical protein
MHQLTNTVMMVRPVDFAFNEQTASDNEFQHTPSEQIDVNSTALAEFEKSVQLLRGEGVNVLILEKSETATVKTPDAVFPNNWISTESDGTVVIFPMYAPNRQAEALRWPDAEKLFTSNGLRVKNSLYLGGTNPKRPILEGTGSMVIDRINRIVYASRSIRTEEAQLQNFVETLGYKKAVVFDAISSTGTAFYHTNVVMSVGDKFAVICTDCVTNPRERENVLSELRAHREVIEISWEQTEKSFCGNIIQIATNNGGSILVMSESAHKGFTDAQRQALSKYGKLVALPINTIEYVGGGSARCMIAEVFLPKAQ